MTDHTAVESTDPTGTPTSPRRPSTINPLDVTIADTAAWLDAHNGTSREEIGLRVLKVAEEAGEAARAWIGYTGQNPRKGATHTTADVVAELADVAFAALVAIASLGRHPTRAVEACARNVATRITTDTTSGRAA